MMARCHQRLQGPGSVECTAGASRPARAVFHHLPENGVGDAREAPKWRRGRLAAGGDRGPPGRDGSAEEARNHRARLDLMSLGACEQSGPALIIMQYKFPILMPEQLLVVAPLYVYKFSITAELAHSIKDC